MVRTNITAGGTSEPMSRREGNLIWDSLSKAALRAFYTAVTRGGGKERSLRRRSVVMQRAVHLKTLALKHLRLSFRTRAVLGQQDFGLSITGRRWSNVAALASRCSFNTRDVAPRGSSVRRAPHPKQA